MIYNTGLVVAVLWFICHQSACILETVQWQSIVNWIVNFRPIMVYITGLVVMVLWFNPSPINIYSGNITKQIHHQSDCQLKRPIMAYITRLVVAVLLVQSITNQNIFW
jgi:hypothetical protein